MSKIQRALAGVAVLAAALAAGPSFALDTEDMVGTRLQASVDADRTIVVDSNTRWVNVAYGETVKFVVGGQTQVVRFDGLGDRLALADVVPGASFPIYVYVDQSVNPLLQAPGGDE